MSSVLKRLRAAISRRDKVYSNSDSRAYGRYTIKYTSQDDVTSLYRNESEELSHSSKQRRNSRDDDEYMLCFENDPYKESDQRLSYDSPFDLDKLIHWLDDEEAQEEYWNAYNGLYGDDVEQAEPIAMFLKPEPDEIKHYGTPHEGMTPHSGRYKYGSGAHPGQHEEWFAGFGEDAHDLYKRYNGYYSKYIRDLKKSGLTDAQIAKGMGIDTKTLTARRSMSNEEYRAAQASEVARILASDPTISNVAIGRIMGIGESQVRNLRRPEYIKNADKLLTLANTLKERVDEKGYIDVGSGSEEWLNVRSSRLQNALSVLKEQGYTVETINVEQVGNKGKYTTIQVLAKPGETKSSIWKNKDKITTVKDFDIDENGTMLGLKYEPKSIDSKRVYVRFAEDGGLEKDGSIELRRGVEDISLGDSKYAQVRIAVDGTHYMKGVAVYSDDIPDGYDVVYNTHKSKGTPLMLDDPKSDNQVFKHLKIDKNTGKINMENPFGATIKPGETGQRTYIDENGKRQVSVINKVYDQGDWGDWKKTISSQMLSKQPLMVARKQLDLAYNSKKAEYDSILSLTNPIVKKHLLEEFADSCDAAAVDLKAAALPRQASHVIIPIKGMKDDEAYCPRLNTGDRVILIRYPHAGTFEIPSLTINNNHKLAKSIIGTDSKDAIGISAATAARLSGADFDGDTVLVIPNNNGSLRTSKPLRGLVGFDPQEAYPGYKGMHEMTSTEKQREMGKVSNLITDMTIMGASEDDIAKAVRHSMVVIDAEKHKLNYKKSFVDNGIADLYKRYQGKSTGGASTLISKASGPYRVDERKEGEWYTDPKTGATKKRYYDPVTGKKLYTPTGRTYIDKKGKEVVAQQESTKMAETDDARKLLSKGGIGTPMERAYADYANNMKDLGNKARLAYLAVETPKVDRGAREVYSAEVKSLREKLAKAKYHSPLERQAQILATEQVEAQIRSNPGYLEDKDALKKLKGQALRGARDRFGGGKELINITDREWEAINAGAIPATTLSDIMKNSDSNRLKQLAMPKANRGLTTSQERLIKTMNTRGYTLAEIAGQLGVSTSTVYSVINPEKK